MLVSPQSGFENFVRDKYTILGDTADRMLASSITATWRYVWSYVIEHTLLLGIKNAFFHLLILIGLPFLLSSTYFLINMFFMN